MGENEAHEAKRTVADPVVLDRLVVLAGGSVNTLGLRERLIRAIKHALEVGGDGRVVVGNLDERTQSAK